MSRIGDQKVSKGSTKDRLLKNIEIDSFKYKTGGPTKYGLSESSFLL